LAPSKFDGAKRFAGGAIVALLLFFSLELFSSTIVILKTWTIFFVFFPSPFSLDTQFSAETARLRIHQSISIFFPPPSLFVFAFDTLFNLSRSTSCRFKE